MTPLRFEQLHSQEWDELAMLLELTRQRRRSSVSLTQERELEPERIAALYRRTCEHLALARERAYPAYMVTRLEHLTSDAHQLIYQQRVFGLGALRHLIAVAFPRAVYRDARYILLAAAVFFLPSIILGVIVYRSPELILSVISPEMAAQFDDMYSPAARSIGRARTVDTDWIMFGIYIRNNIGVAFQCFASGLFFGVGSLFFLSYNAALGGAVAGYLTQRGFGSTFYSFIATHSAFELTAIVLAGGAGLKIGHALLAPGRRSRVAALVVAAQESAVILYGVTVMLVIAAAIEAFWSSASWLPPTVKYSVAAICWAAVLGYLLIQGRRAR
jgi:uncharacterized membrane protein SpoIIM required for sporulation